MAITKYVLPVVAGTMSGGILMKSGERALQYIYPLPTGIDINDKAALAGAIRNMPTSAFLLLLISSIISSFVAGIVATLIAGRTAAAPAIAVGLALTLAGIFNIMAVPQPVWFCITSIISYLPFTYLGYMIVRRQKEADVAL